MVKVLNISKHLKQNAICVVPWTVCRYGNRGGFPMFSKHLYLDPLDRGNFHAKAKIDQFCQINPN